MNGQHYAILAGVAVAVFLVFLQSLIGFCRSTGSAACLRLVGSGFLLVVVLAHVCETFHLLTGMGWGQEHSPGHYLDLASATLGPMLLAVGFVLHSPMRKSV
jgi:hypothetical protein